ncbi:unnamed protein product [Vitrella brassicaformis CCMP3155]|uniref:Uncharacterized protein n=1 Tax=Vitrella brassicaformis (strain CCMP3155) TaxID=1169540 RepID=A0A0G4EH77_VITBC|nr:unnamed protein product [Vitrella brassicaformis CCMP3155]|eukprot:CEL94729.1 unnamed protein product [Vitrella brassicaformis CCMP3155]
MEHPTKNQFLRGWTSEVQIDGRGDANEQRGRALLPPLMDSRNPAHSHLLSNKKSSRQQWMSRRPQRHRIEGEYGGKKDGATNVLYHVDILVADIRKAQAVADTEEKNDVDSYQTDMAQWTDQWEKRMKEMTEQEGIKAAADQKLNEVKKELRDERETFDAVHSKLASLHESCDFLLRNYDTRKQARAKERDYLLKAKATLMGATFAEPTAPPPVARVPSAM